MAQADRQGPGHTRPGQWGPGVPRRWWTVPPPPRTHTFLALMLLVALLALITQQSLTAATGMPAIAHIDKVLHLAAYSGVGALALPALRGQGLLALGLAVLWGIGVEIAQGVMDLGRDMSGGDVVANMVGAVAGVSLSAALLRAIARRNSRETGDRGISS